MSNRGTLSQRTRELGVALALHPECSEIFRLASDIEDLEREAARMRCTLDEIASDAAEDARLAEQAASDGVVVMFRRARS